MSTTIRLNLEQARQVRQVLLYGLPEGLDDATETRESIVEHLADTQAVLDRLDRLGWEDRDEGYEYTDEPDKLAYMAARLIEWGTDQNHDRGENSFEEATRRREQLEPALAGVAILDQLEATR